MDHKELLKAFSEEQKAEETMGTNKTKSKVRAKSKRSAKLDNEARKRNQKKAIVAELARFEREIRRNKRVIATSSDRSSAKLRRAVSNFKQAISEI
tara:strand:+ start:1288 stop:1575 length:288 start_codon:yes stop_codon:yes gene_type:complete